MDESRRRKRGVLLASLGFALALAAGIVLKALGVAGVDFADWVALAALTAAVQAALWLIPHLGLDQRLTFDRHYLWVPMTAAARLLAAYALVIVELRFLVLMGWLVALLFVAGNVGFRGVGALSFLMAVAYMAAIYINFREGHLISSASRPPRSEPSSSSACTPAWCSSGSAATGSKRARSAGASSNSRSRTRSPGCPTAAASRRRSAPSCRACTATAGSARSS